MTFVPAIPSTDSTNLPQTDDTTLLATETTPVSSPLSTMSQDSPLVDSNSSPSLSDSSPQISRNYFRDLEIQPTLNPTKIQLAFESVMQYLGPLSSPKALERKLSAEEALHYLRIPKQRYKHYKYIKSQLNNRFTFHSSNNPPLTLFSNYPTDLDFHTGSPYPDDISSVLVDMDALAIIEHRSKKVYLYNQELDEKEGTISNRFTLKKVFHEMDRACTTSAAECLVVYFDILLDSHRIYSGLSHISPSLDLQASLFNIFEKIKLFVKDQRSEGYFYLYAGTPASIQHFNKTFNPEIFQQETNYRIDSKPRIQNSPAEPEEYPEYVNFYTFLDFALVEKVKADDEVVYYKQEFNFLSDLNEFDIQSPSLGYHSDSSMNTASSEETFRLSTSVVAAHSSNNDSNSSMESISSAETFRLSLPDITALTNNASSLSLDSVSSEENFRMPLSDTMVLNRR